MEEKLKEDILTYIQLFLNNVELNIYVDKNLKRKKEHIFGYFQITDGKKDDEPLYWDNIEFFIEAKKERFKEECGKELEEKGYDWKQTYKEIKTLLKRAKKLRLI